jgi:pimeloyl-ACP methyl ester carboxylesterase
MRPGLEVHAAKGRASDAADLIAGWATSLPDMDRAVLTAEFGEDMVANEAEAFRLGVDGYIDDNIAFVTPWGFSLAEIAVPTFVWHGSQDTNVPFAHGQWLAAHVPGATLRLKQGEGHVSIGVGALDRMFDDLITASSD